MSLPCTQRWTRRWPRTQAGSACNPAFQSARVLRSSVRSRYVLDGGHGRTGFADSRAVQEIAAERDSDADGHGDGQEIRNAEVPPVARRVRGRHRVTGSSRNLHRRADYPCTAACFNIRRPIARSSFCMGATPQAAIEPSLPTTACSLYPLALQPAARPYPACRSFEQPPIGRGLPSIIQYRGLFPRGASSERSISCSICWTSALRSGLDMVLDNGNFRRRSCSGQFRRSHAQDTGRPQNGHSQTVTMSSAPYRSRVRHEACSPV